MVRQELGGLPLIAEDLGLITPDVGALRDQFHLPGTRVLQFAFDRHSDNPHLPDNYTLNTVVYTGTHDNPTTREWYEESPDTQRQTLWRYLKREGRGSEAALALIELAWSSRAALAIVPLQDVLNLGAEARMNTPGRGQLALALHRRHVVRFRDRMAAGIDEGVEPLRTGSVRANGLVIVVVAIASIPENALQGSNYEADR